MFDGPGCHRCISVELGHRGKRLNSEEDAIGPFFLLLLLKWTTDNFGRNWFKTGLANYFLCVEFVVFTSGIVKM